MANRTPLAIHEWYHCYNRGVDKRKIFDSKTDYERFLLLMYVCNSDTPVHISNMKDHRLETVIADKKLKRGDPLTEVGAYALMPNHFHFVLKEIKSGGIALFMQKILTGYTMYFNKKNERTGALFASTFKSRHVNDDRYLKYLISYVHLNPVGLFDARQKKGNSSLASVEKFLNTYSYSSLPEFTKQKRPHKAILGESAYQLFDEIPKLKRMILDAQTYTLDDQGLDDQGLTLI